MYSILKAEALASNIYSMVVKAPRVAKHCLPGQFVIVKSDEVGERSPLTICDYDREEGTITIVFQPIGASTEKFARLKAGDAFEDFVGPLGHPSELCSEDLEELKKKGYSPSRIHKEHLLSDQTVQSIREKKNISLATLNKICIMLKVQPGDLIEVVPTNDEILKYY